MEEIYSNCSYFEVQIVSSVFSTFTLMSNNILQSAKHQQETDSEYIGGVSW